MVVAIFSWRSHNMSYINTETLEYPISEQTIRELYPNTTFAVPFVAPEPFAVVFESPIPTVSLWQYLMEGPPVFVNEIWIKQWIVHDRDKDLVLQQAKADIKNQVTSLRWQIETGGITLPSGKKIGTDKIDQSAIANALTTLREGFVNTIDWKEADGWATITINELLPIAQAVAIHVQTCFTVEK